MFLFYHLFLSSYPVFSIPMYLNDYTSQVLIMDFLFFYRICLLLQVLFKANENKSKTIRYVRAKAETFSFAVQQIAVTFTAIQYNNMLFSCCRNSRLPCTMLFLVRYISHTNTISRFLTQYYATLAFAHSPFYGRLCIIIHIL